MDELDALVRVLDEGGVVACPTETWLGLLADARNQKAVERVAELKGRPPDMPIALLLPDASAVVALRVEDAGRQEGLPGTGETFE